MVDYAALIAPLTIRPLETYAECLACDDIQMDAWDTGHEEVTPGHLLVAASHYGGIVSGAFDGEKVVGFVYSFIGEAHHPAWIRGNGGRFFQWSHQLAVLRAYQGKKLGYALKLHQREVTMGQGIRLVGWTYDPLMSLNAALNIRRLGTVVRHFIPNLYGELGGINAGLPTDRFEAEWWIESQHVRDRLDEQAPPPTLESWRLDGVEIINESGERPDGLRQPSDHTDVPGGAPALLIESPGDLQQIKKADMRLAQGWAAGLMTLFTAAFESEDRYVVTDFLVDRSGDSPRGFYLLQPEQLLEWLPSDLAK